MSVIVFILPTLNATNNVPQLNGRAGLKSWQWAFLIEGALLVVLAVPVYFALLSFPETDKSLSERGEPNLPLGTHSA